MYVVSLALHLVYTLFSKVFNRQSDMLAVDLVKIVDWFSKDLVRLI